MTQFPTKARRPINAISPMHAGAYHDKITAGGEVLSDHMLFGTVVATMLIVVVTAQGGRDAIYFKVYDWWL